MVADERHQLNVKFLRGLTAQVALMKNQGHKAVLISSGAVAAGRSEVKFKRGEKDIPFRQALAAVGQGVLMKTYHDFFKRRGITVAQALLTNYDFANRENFLNSKNVFKLLLEHDVVPIVNENDVTTIAELKFGDNDILSAKTAVMIQADFLIIMTDVDGLCSADPRQNPDAELIPVVHKIDSSIRGIAKGARGRHSRGGMTTKIAAAEYATSAGTPMFIVNGKKKGILIKTVEFCERIALLRRGARVKTEGFRHGTFFPV